MIAWLDNQENKCTFPSVDRALTDPDGLLAAGGDLSPQRLLYAYSHGIFPWYNAQDPILWWSPSQRMVLFTDQLKISRSMQKVLHNTHYDISVDQAFEQVIAACAAPRHEQDGTWITQAMQHAYIHLHHLGFAHSVETWANGQLVGGLYGVSLGRMFYGESMFSRQSNASKLALIHITQHLKQQGVSLIDCQIHSPHLETLGAQRMDRSTFITHIQHAITLPPTPSMWKYHYSNSKSDPSLTKR